MNEIMFWGGYAVLGLLAGLFGSALGVGGGIIMVPVLVILYHVPQKSAQGISLAVMVAMCLAASMRYWADPATRMDLRVVGLIAAFAIGGAYVGVELMRVTPVGVLQKIFAAVMVVMAVRLAFFPSDAGKAKAGQPPTNVTRAGDGGGAAP